MVARLGRPDQFVILKKPFDVMEVQQLADAMSAKWDELQKTRRRIEELQNSVDGWMTELRASREQAADVAQGINQPAQDLVDNARFLRDAFAKIDHLLRCHAGLLEAVKAGHGASEQVALVEQALKAADLDYLTSRVPEVLEQTMERAEAVSRVAGAL
jgi:prophage DNA circulation protein